MNTAISFIEANKTVSALVAFWLASNFVSALPSPDQGSAGLYKWFFSFSHGLAGSLPRIFPNLRLPSDSSRGSQTFFGNGDKPAS